MRASWSVLRTLQLLSCFAATSGCDCSEEQAVDAGSDSDSDSDTDVDPCAGDGPRPDEIVPVRIASDFDGDALQLATDWRSAVVCGTRSAVAVDLESGDVGDPRPLASPCTGVAIENGRAVVADAEGTLVLFSVAAGGALVELDRDENVAGRYRGVALSGGTALVAAGQLGVLRFDTSGGDLVALEPWTAATDARAVASAGDGTIAVADGEAGVKMLDDAGAVIASLELPDLTMSIDTADLPLPKQVTVPYEGQTVAVSDRRIVIGSGAYGYEWASREGDSFGDLRQPGAELMNEGPVFDVDLHGDDEIVYAEGGSIRRVGIGPDDTISRLSSEYRPDRRSLDGGWWVGVEAGDGEALLLSTSALYRATLGRHVPAPDMDLERQSLRAELAARQTGPFLFPVRNHGDCDLRLVIESVEPAAFGATFLDLAGLDLPDARDPTRLWLPVGGNGGVVEVEFSSGNGSPVEGSLVLGGNDPDESPFEVPLHGNPDPVDVGERAPSFALTTLEGGVYRSADHLDEVVLLMFFDDC